MSDYYDVVERRSALVKTLHTMNMTPGGALAAHRAWEESGGRERLKKLARQPDIVTLLKRYFY